MPDNDLVAMVLAKRKAKADAARASQDAAAAQAKAKPRVADPPTESPVKPPGEFTEGGTRILNEAPSIGIPKPSTSTPYDFESHSVKAETDLHSKVLGADTEVLPQKSGSLATKVIESRSPRPLKTIAESVAEVKAPEVPIRPLPGQGVLADKPIQKILDRRGKNIATPKSLPEAPKVAEAPKPAPEKVITSEGAVENVTRKAVKAAPKAESIVQNYPASTPLAGNEGAIKNFGQATKAIVKEAPEVPSLASKAVPVLRKAGQWAGKMAGKAASGIKSDILELDPTKPYRALKAGRGAAAAAGEAAPGLMRGFAQDAGALVRGASRGLKGLAEGAVLQSTGENAYHTTKDLVQVHSDAERNQGANVKQGAKYGLKVTNDTPMQAVGKSIADRLGMDTDSSPDVKEDPALKAKFLASNKKRIQGLRTYTSGPSKSKDF